MVTSMARDRRARRVLPTAHRSRNRKSDGRDDLREPIAICDRYPSIHR
jgi:hypothetical protein